MALSILDLFSLTWNSLSGNLLRSSLTTLGVFMGVGAVSATLQVGNISRAVIEKQLAEREAPQVSLYIFQDEIGPVMKLEDMEFLKKRITEIKAISGSNWFGYSQENVIFQNEKADPNMSAVTLDYFETSGRLKIAGRYFTQADFDNFKPVVVIDETLKDKLFNQIYPISKQIYIDNRPYTVIGIMETKGPFRGEPKGELVVPITISNAMTGTQQIIEISIRPNSIEDIKNLEEKVQKIMKQRFPKANINAWNNVRQILQQRETLEMTSKALLAVGGIALLVGGVGIANITIAAIIERTPEIGLRKAIGATQSDIMLQFILEAGILSLVGGIAAIITVHGITLLVAQTFELPYEFDSNSALIALSSALFVGIGACFIPAVRASQLDPVKALRSE